MSVPRGLRNNNPGNIRLSKDKWQGLRERQEDKVSSINSIYPLVSDSRTL